MTIRATANYRTPTLGSPRLQALNAFQRQYREIPKQISGKGVPKGHLLMAPQTALGPRVQSPATPHQIPSQLKDVVNGNLCFFAEQDGMLVAREPEHILGKAKTQDDLQDLLSEMHVLPLKVNGQHIIAAMPNSEENLEGLASVAEQLSTLDNSGAPGSESQPDAPASNVQHSASSAQATEADGIGEGNDAAEELGEHTPEEERGCCSQIFYVLCSPFRWIGQLFMAIGRCFGLCG